MRGRRRQAGHAEVPKVAGGDDSDPAGRPAQEGSATRTCTGRSACSRDGSQIGARRARCWFLHPIRRAGSRSWPTPGSRSWCALRTSARVRRRRRRGGGVHAAFGGRESLRRADSSRRSGASRGHCGGGGRSGSREAERCCRCRADAGAALRPSARSDHRNLPAQPVREGGGRRDHARALRRSDGRRRLRTTSPAASRWTRRAPMRYRAWRRSSSIAWRAATSTWSDFRWRWCTGI